MDKAPWHSSPTLVLLQNVEAVLEPSYSPELQPTGHLWLLSDERIANRSTAVLTTSMT